MKSEAAAARPGWVYLVGAGPGDPELITVRGAALLGGADMVLYDEDIDRGLLELISAGVAAYPVASLGIEAPANQEAFRVAVERLVAEARAGRRVVRLMSGDPYLLGGGAALALGLRDAGVPFEVIPGVSALQAATANAGIPLTHATARSVMFVSATEHDGRPFDWASLEGARGTLCVFLGTQQLKRISRALVVDSGYAARSPSVLLQGGRTLGPYTLADMADGSLDREVTRDTMLVVGETAALRQRLRWFDAQPLFGRRVLVPRPRHQLGPTTALLRRRGAVPVPFPTIAIEPPPDPERVTRAVLELGNYDLVAFTSHNGVVWFWRAMDQLGCDGRAFGGAKVAAIGPATAAELERRGVRANVVAEQFVAEDLARAITSALGEGEARVLLPRALVAREVLPEKLREAGMQVDVVPVYRTVTASSEWRDYLRQTIPSIDIVMLTSSSTATKLVELLGDDALALLAGRTIASIGPITTATAEDLGLQVAITAEVSTAAGLVDALEQAFGWQGYPGSR